MLFRSLPTEPANQPTAIPNLWLLALLFVAWMLPGLIGHDPWKPDEAYSFGLVYHILQSGDWVVPTLAGEPFMEKPPLYYLVAALFARGFSFMLPLHDGARLASGFFMGLTFLFTALGARELFGKNTGKGWIAAVILLGCLGLLVRTHQIITDVALLSAYAIGLFGLALCLRRPVAGGIWLGIGAGIGFLSKGLIAPGILGIIAVALLLFKSWRNKKYPFTLLVALGVVLPWLVIWPLALYLRSPDLFVQWLGVNSFGKLSGLIKIAPATESLYYLKILPWFTWPALPLALWTLWVTWAKRGTHASTHGGGWNQPGIQLPVIAFIVMLSVLMFSTDAREVYALPLLLPLSLLAALGVDTLRRGAANALYWFGIMGFTFFAGVFWFYWGALELSIPTRLSAHLHEMQPGYSPGFKPLVFILSLVYCLAWIILLLRLKRGQEKPVTRPVIVWAAGIALVWGMLMTLFVGWLDTGKSYRSMVASMQQSLPAHYRCIASKNLGESQRAMLHYYGKMVTQRIELATAQNDKSGVCDLFLAQGNATTPVAPPGKGWKKIWQGARPGDDIEAFWLYRRN